MKIALYSFLAITILLFCDTSQALDECITSVIADCLQYQTTYTNAGLADICVLCGDGKIPDSSYSSCVSCEQEVPGCSVCDVDIDSYLTYCTECDDAKLPAYGGKSCINSCDVDNCEGCSADDECASCEGSMYVDTDGTCKVCNVDNCDKCLAADTCGLCSEGFVPNNDDGQCLACSDWVEGCETCGYHSITQQYECYTCADGKFPGLNNGEEACMECSEIYGSCLECHIVEDIYTKCETCVEGKSPSNNGECIVCDVEGCGLCDSNGDCIRCADVTHYVNEAGACAPCSDAIENCEYCSVYQGVVSCFKCSGGWVTAADFQTCVDCDERFPDCESCIFDSDPYTFSHICMICGPDTFLAPNQLSCDACADIIPDCESCAEGDGGVAYCESCSGDLVPSPDGSCCGLCSAGIPECTSCGESGACEECANGKEVSADAKSCVACDVEDCDGCSDDNVCEECAAGMSPNEEGNECVTDASSNLVGASLLMLMLTSLLLQLICG